MEDPFELVATLGPFFSVDRWEPDAGWRPLSELTTEPEVLRDRVASARAVLADRSQVPIDEIQERATASIVFMGLAARLVSPAFGCAVLAGELPNLRFDELWWQPVTGGPWPLARTVAERPSSVELPSQLDDMVFVRIVTPVLDAFVETFAISPQVMWGNVASSLGGALTMLIAARPDRTEDATQLVQGLLASGSLKGTGSLDASRRSFKRHSCCLFYRIPSAGICGDCVLVAAPNTGH